MRQENEELDSNMHIGNGNCYYVKDDGVVKFPQ